MANKTRPTDNGRSSLNELKGSYDKVVIKHDKNTDGSGRTTVLLVKGTTVFVGVAKFSNRGDSYSRTHGRLIAQGRAELAAEVASGKTTERVNASKQREKLSYKIESLNVERTLEAYIKSTVEV
jgi:hypothetical protein